MIPIMKIETIAVHSGRTADVSTGAVKSPIHLSTTFERDPDGEYSRGFSYSREGNPNRTALETCLTELEGGAAAVSFSSGMAAAQAVLQTLSAGCHVLLHHDLYFGLRHLLQDVLRRWMLQHTFVDMTRLDAVRAAIQPNTRLLWLETPSNPMLDVIDIEAIAALAGSVEATLICENTFATPILQRPLQLGAVAVVHSLTKYLSGHSDVTGGAVVCRSADPLLHQLRTIQQTAGAVLAPFDCWLTLRGIETLPLRVRQQCANAARIAEFLESQPGIRACHYPGLKSHPGHAVAARQMSAFGAMLSFEVRGGRPEAMAVANRLKLITRATSLGGTHTLIEHRASIEGPETRAPQSLLRLSVGIENVEDLVEDLAQALQALR
jgi:cystathionine gamma-synthase